MGPLFVMILGVLLVICTIFVSFLLFVRLLWKAGPNEAVIVYGVSKPHVVTNGAIIVIPGLQQAKRLSLELMPIDIFFSWRSFNASHATAHMRATIVLKVNSDKLAVTASAVHFLDKTIEERQRVLRPILEHHLRTMLATASLETLDTWSVDPECAALTMLEAAAPGMDRLGLSIIAFTITPSPPA